MISPINFVYLYIFIYFSFLFLLIINAIKKRNNTLLAVSIFVASLSIVCGLRSPAVGTDTYAFYLLTKQMVLENSFLWSKDYLYYGLTRLTYPIFGYLGTVFFPALLTSLMLSLSYREIIKNEFIECYDVNKTRGLNQTFYLTLAFLLLINSSDFLFQIINQTRQLLSLSFALYGGVALFYKRLLKSIVFFILATFSHHSAPLVIACFIGVCIIRNIKIWFLILSISAVLSLSGLSKHVLGFLGLTIDEDSVYYQALNSNAVLYVKTVITCSLGLTCYFLTRRMKREKTLHNYLLNFYMAICSLAVLLVVYGEASNRIQRYAGVIFPILFSITLKKIRINEWLIILIVLISMLYMVFFMSYDATLITIGIYRKESLPL